MERDFKGVWISRDIWLDNRLNALDKVILAEIDSLDRSERGCYASNKHIAEFCQCSETKVSTAISKLIKLGYLYIKSFDGRQRELKSRLSNFERQNFKKCDADFEKLKESNTDNNTFNNTNNKKKERKTTYDKIIGDKITDAELKGLIYEFIKMRKMKKKPLTDRALTIQLNKLLKLSTSIDEQKQIVETSIVRCWDEFYPLKKEANNDTRNNRTDGSEYAFLG
jgi:MarR-like DNA-binding transcriptional regulator SgrR of sgrS sRNA